MFDPKEGLQNVRQDNFKCSSDRTDDILPTWGYNCIAWAVGKTDAWWWPSGDLLDYWPIPLDADDPEGVEQFAKAFKTEGYDECKDDSFVDGYEKIALYLDATGPTHAARQLPDGKWTSKLGKMEDIEHDTLTVLEGKSYGKAKVYFCKPNPAFVRPAMVVS